MRIRQRFVVLHRYIGLVMAGFLIIAGLTGALLVWYYELDALINPDLLQVDPPHADSEPLSPFVLREKVDAAFPTASVNWIMLTPPDTHGAARFFIDPKPGTTALLVDEVFVDPYSGEVLGSRLWGDLAEGTTNLMPFIHRLHHSLALGTIGTWAFGLISLLWILDCFISAWLTFPPAQSRNGPRRQRRFWKRWVPAWKIRWRAGPHKRYFDLHRAGGLWPWALLLVFAWSSVAMNLYSEVYRPTTETFLAYQEDPLSDIPTQNAPSGYPRIGWEKGFQIARQELETLASEQGFSIKAVERFAYYPPKNVLKLMAHTSRDVNQRFGETWLYINATTGTLIGYYLPTGQASGDTLTTWLTTLHIAALGGAPYRIVVTLLGLMVAVLSVTGVMIWWKKRKARR